MQVRCDERLKDIEIPDCLFVFFQPRFLEWESFSDFAFS